MSRFGPACGSGNPPRGASSVSNGWAEGTWAAVIVAASIVGTLGLLSLLLYLTEVVERKVVSEPVLIARVIRARRLSPEYVEAFVANRAERLISRR